MHEPQPTLIPIVILVMATWLWLQSNIVTKNHIIIKDFKRSWNSIIFQRRSSERDNCEESFQKQECQRNKTFSEYRTLNHVQCNAMYKHGVRLSGSMGAWWVMRQTVKHVRERWFVIVSVSSHKFQRKYLRKQNQRYMNRLKIKWRFRSMMNMRKVRRGDVHWFQNNNYIKYYNYVMFQK